MIGPMATQQPSDNVPEVSSLAPTRKTCSVPKSWVFAFILVVITFIAYIPAMRCGFIWDDDDHFTKNPAMTMPHGIRMIWSSLAISRYYPLTLTTFWVERRLWGLHAMPYHVINIALHALNGVLVYFVLRRLRIPAPWLAAILWVLHPVNVESVAWITEQKNTQSGVFFFFSLWCFLRVEVDKKRNWYALAVVCGLAALLSKPSTVVLPVVLLLCTWWQRGRLRRVDMLRTIPFFAMSLGMSALTIIEQRTQLLNEHASEWKLSIAERCIVAGKAILFYATKLFWPTRLTFVYLRWDLAARSVPSWIPLIAVIIVGALLWVWRRQAWTRAALLGFGFFGLALLPVLGFFDVFYFQYSFVADHFQYLASLGLIAMAASAGMKLCERNGKIGRIMGITVATAIVITFMGLCWKQEHIYHDVETLWRDTIAKNPQCWMAENNLGEELIQKNETDEAKLRWQRALRIKPDYYEAYNNLGRALTQAGETSTAIGLLEHAVHIKPEDPRALVNLGNALVKAGRLDTAIASYKQALKGAPDYFDACFDLAVVLSQTVDSRDAIEYFQEALRLRPEYIPVQYRLAHLLAILPTAEGGDPIRAISLAQRACQSTGYKSAVCADTLATAYAAAGQSNEAVTVAQAAIDLARSTSQTQLVGQIELRLELYRAGQPYR
jgi:tetratricopeptide (TPR) repeat protein